MMSLGQAIEHAEEVARANESLVSNYERDKKIAEIHRQIADLLKELQERRKADSCKGCMHKYGEKLICQICARYYRDKYVAERKTDENNNLYV